MYIRWQLKAISLANNKKAFFIDILNKFRNLGSIAHYRTREFVELMLGAIYSFYGTDVVHIETISLHKAE